MECPNCKSDKFDGWDCKDCRYALPRKARKAQGRLLTQEEMEEEENKLRKGLPDDFTD